MTKLKTFFSFSCQFQHNFMGNYNHIYKHLWMLWMQLILETKGSKVQFLMMATNKSQHLFLLVKWMRTVKYLFWKVTDSFSFCTHSAKLDFFLSTLIMTFQCSLCRILRKQLVLLIYCQQQLHRMLYIKFFVQNFLMWVTNLFKEAA